MMSNENQCGRGPVYVFGNARVETQETAAVEVSEALRGTPLA